jgi:predicted HicB family RNase H-like nuclease
MEVQTQNHRRHFYFHTFLSAFRAKPTVSDNVWDFVRSSVEGLPVNASIQVGRTLRQDKWISVSSNSVFSGFFNLCWKSFLFA